MQLIEGYLAPIDQTIGLDEEIRFKVFKECYARYRIHVSENADLFSPSARRFIQDYVLGGVHRKSLHDETIKKISINFPMAEPEGLGVSIDICVQHQQDMIALSLVYASVDCRSIPDAMEGAIINRHELIINEGRMQHILYTIGNEPIQLICSEISAVALAS